MRLSALLALALAFAGFTTSAQAAVIVNAVDSGGMTTFTGSGSFDLGAWNMFSNESVAGNSNPNTGLVIGSDTLTAVDKRFGLVDASSFMTPSPNNYGPGQGGVTPATGSGDVFGLVFSGAGTPFVIVPDAYTTGSPLSGSMSYNVGFAVLGISPGTYMWTWGTGANADSFTLNASVVPEPSTAVLMMLGLVGLASHRRRS